MGFAANTSLDFSACRRLGNSKHLCATQLIGADAGSSLQYELATIQLGCREDEKSAASNVCGLWQCLAHRKDR